MTKIDEEILAEIALSRGAHKVGIVTVADIPFRREFRDLCALNQCGKYGRCWSCPPDIGDIDEMIAAASAYRRACVFQTVGSLEDSFDYYGMELAVKIHSGLTQALIAELKPLLGDFLTLGAGACDLCERCTKLDGEACRFPEKIVPTMEACGIAVSELAPLCGMQYINGADTVTYFSAFFYH